MVVAIISQCIILQLHHNICCTIYDTYIIQCVLHVFVVHVKYNCLRVGTMTVAIIPQLR